MSAESSQEAASTEIKVMANNSTSIDSSTSLAKPEGASHPHAAIAFSEDKHRQGGVARRVVCAVDASNHSRVAFEWYLKNIWKREDVVIILYCPEPPHLPSIRLKDGLSLPTERWREIITETNVRVNKLESDYESLCIEKKLKYLIRMDVSKHPGEGILKVVEREAAGLIVMGTRGMGAVKRFFLGSVSEYVTRHSKIPCIVVPNEGAPSQPQ